MVILGIFIVTYRLERIQAWLKPSIDPLGEGDFIGHIRRILENASFLGNQGISSVLMENRQGDIVLPLGQYNISEYAFNFILGSMGKMIAFSVALVVEGLVSY